MNKYFILVIIFIMPSNSFAQGQIASLVTPVTYFVDHVKQLNLLKNNLIKHRQASIIGTSGMGKTQLARMYSYENQNNYKLIWFIDCNLDINQELLKLAKAINSTTKSDLISEDMKLVRKEVMSYLSSQEKWLLVFDNLKVSGNKKVQEFVDWEHNGHVIFCSQDSEMLPNIFKMTAFEKSDIRILANNILEHNDPKSVEFLSEEFAGYPILIVQGVQLLNNVSGLNREGYRKRIHQSTDKIKLNITLAINELKPNARNLLNKIALINNQGFSKELLSFITDDQSTINDDIYQLSKFALISNIDPNDTNPIFEMHDVIAQKIAEINGNKNNKAYLEDIVTKLVGCVPKTVIKAQIFRKAKTIHENFEILARNAEKYNANIYKLLQLNAQLIIKYINYFDYCNAERLVNWFNKNDQQGTGKFNLWLMNNDEKYTYAKYLQAIGVYHSGYSNHRMAIKYFIRTQEISDDLQGYESLKWGLLYHVAVCNISLGQLQEAEKNIQVIEEMFNEGLMDKSDISYIHSIKSLLLVAQGKYSEALEQSNKFIETLIKNGVSPDDVMLVKPYLVGVGILNYLKEYQQAYDKIKQLYDLYKSSRKNVHEIFGRIYNQMAKSELGLGKIDQASEHVNQAISIFLADEHRNPKDVDYSEDPNLAISYVVQGDILFAQNKIKAAIESYKKAYTIYYYLYGDNSKNVAQVSYMYSQGAKAACKAKDLYNYKFFGKSQVKEFGVDHSNTVSMFEYCKRYDMDLWVKGN
ncbi:tetratricopeptide repeat protein [Candidatus Tisiphia endosymbiont of Micropterix aruncella]|uniref:tetratricopeptide repeat protein n=1 Tax=Candidatus Tisiphia endosymbiont of Micropterix aruncella TaxID=3066271 RepID=UPI003AA89774